MGLVVSVGRDMQRRKRPRHHEECQYIKMITIFSPYCKQLLDNLKKREKYSTGLAYAFLSLYSLCPKSLNRCPEREK